MMLRVGQAYTRDEIAARLGGGRRSCLPTRDGKVLVACILPSFNPQAPNVILCGTGTRNEPAGALLAGQAESIPVFVKEAANHWIYRGCYRTIASCTDGPRFESALAVSDRTRASVSRAVFLERVGDR